MVGGVTISKSDNRRVTAAHRGPTSPFWDLEGKRCFSYCNTIKRGMETC